MKKYFIWMAIWLVLPSQIAADAIVRSTAMFAETIAEYYVEEDHVRLELEIGEQDIASFRNLLPDQLYQQLEFGDAPLEDRLSLFTLQDMAIYHDGKALQGFVREIGPATRPKRDDVTGEELPNRCRPGLCLLGDHPLRWQRVTVRSAMQQETESAD